MLDAPTPDQLPKISSNEFLPRISPWAIMSGGLMIAIFGTTVVLAAVLKYNVAVKVAATIRPAGELRLVQAAIAGSITQILVEENQRVEAGQAIAYIDDSRLLTTKSQLQGDLQQVALQLGQIRAQLNALDSRILAEANLMQRTIRAAQAEVESQRRQYQDQQRISEADFQAAEAAQVFAQEELTRFRQLEQAGAIATLLLREKEAAVATATAKVNRAASVLNPTAAAIARAEEQVAQAQAQGEAALATLQQQREQLLQNQIELQRQRDRSQKELQQIENDFNQTVIRAPIAGTLLQLNLRNPQQVVSPREVAASIAPFNAPLLIKAQVPAQDIDKVNPEQTVQMQISACPYPDYGILQGAVKTVAPDALPAANNSAGAPQQATYEVTIQPQTKFVGDADHQCQLQAGMEGKATIISRQETVLQFILRKIRLLSNV